MPYPKDVKVGDILVAQATVINNIGDRWPAGTEMRVDKLDISGEHKTLCLEEPGDYGNGGYWFYFGDLQTSDGSPDNDFKRKEATHE